MKKSFKNVLIIGGGNIGLNLAKMLEEHFEDLRIKIIEKDKKKQKKLQMSFRPQLLLTEML